MEYKVSHFAPHVSKIRREVLQKSMKFSRHENTREKLLLLLYALCFIESV